MTILAVDLLTKPIFQSSEPFDVVPGFFSIHPRVNTGGVFGLLAGTPWANTFFIAVSAGAIGFIAMVLRTTKTRHRHLFGAAAGAVLGGALGNLFDRVLHGHVRDFLDFHAGPYAWPTFNVADAGITTGTALLAWLLWREEPPA